MIQIFFKTHPHRWLILLALATLAFFSLAFQGGDTDPAHCQTCATPTFTPTPTWTPTPIPTLQQCQIDPIIINGQTTTPPPAILEVPAGQPLNFRLFVKDFQGKPIIGANVDATVNRQPLADSVQASAIPRLQDMAGYYDGVYLLTDLPGVYTFTFSVSDFGGPRFSPCSATRIVQVKEVPRCSISLEAAPREVEVNTPISLTATITNTLCTSVTTNVQLPGGGIQPLLTPLAGPANICTGNYTPALTGTYTFTAASTNSAGQLCYSDPVTVNVKSTPPLSPTVDLKFPSQTIDLCRLTDPIAATLAISNVTNLTGVEIEVTYDKSFMQVIDAFGPPRPPLQQVEVKPDANFDPWLRNEVDTDGGIIYFAANAHTPVNGHTNVIYTNWQPQGRTGDTLITVNSILTDASGKVIRLPLVTSTIAITIGSPCRTGFATLQGRTDHSGITVTGTNGEQAHSYPNGLFAIASTGPFNLSFPGYLPAQADLPQSAAASTAITLRAGDVNGDSKIDILDLAQLAQLYQSTDSLADLNGDGVVNILDLALVAGNFQQHGPLTNGQ